MSTFHDVSELAAASGLRGGVRVTGALWQRHRDPARREALLHAVLLRLHDILAASAGDPGLTRLRQAVLLGEEDASPGGSAPQIFASARWFLNRLRLGILGPSQDGRLLSFDLTAGAERITLVAAFVPRYTFLSCTREPVLLILDGEECRQEAQAGAPFAAFAALGQLLIPR